MKFYIPIVLIFLLFCCQLFAQKASSTEAQIDLLLEKLDRGESIENLTVNLRDINFKLNSAELNPQSFEYLNKVGRFLKKVPNMEIRIEGHTDNSGEAAYNLRLSKERAESVRSYLTSIKVDSQRLAAQGFGMKKPLADNSTAQGRAKNRRVTFVVIRKESVKTIQDLIILANGDTLGATIIDSTALFIKYKTFKDEEEKNLPYSKIQKILYANGNTWTKPIPQQKKEAAPTEPLIDFDNILDQIGTTLFTGPDYFGPGVSTLGLHAELINNIRGDRPYDSTTYIPGISVSYERQAFKNFGWGANLGIHRWGDPVQAYNYSYLSLGFRATYHPRVARKIDPYLGWALSYRLILLNEAEVGPQSYQNVDYDWFLGCRYFPTRRLGLFGELGSDAVSKLNLGLILIMGELPENW